MRIDHLSSMRWFSKRWFSIFENRYLIIEDDDEMKKGKSEIRYRKSWDISKSEMAISHACKNLDITDVASTLSSSRSEVSEQWGTDGGRWQALGRRETTIWSRDCSWTRAKRRKVKSETTKSVQKQKGNLYGKERTATFHKRQQKGLHCTETEALRVGWGALAFSFCEQRQTTTVTSSLRNVDAVLVVVFCSFWTHCELNWSIRNEWRVVFCVWQGGRLAALPCPSAFGSLPSALPVASRFSRASSGFGCAVRRLRQLWGNWRQPTVCLNTRSRKWLKLASDIRRVELLIEVDGSRSSCSDCGGVLCIGLVRSMRLSISKMWQLITRVKCSNWGGFIA